MTDGLKSKYRIFKHRTDGSLEVCVGCYFVLKLDSKDKAHSEASIAAALAYAKVIRGSLPKLADDIERAIDTYRRGFGWVEWCVLTQPGGESGDQR